MATFDVSCNWKTVIDIFNEMYHIQGVHPNLLGVYDDASGRDGVYGPHMMGTYACARPSRLAQGSPGISPELSEFVSSFGVDVASLENDPSRIPGAIRAALDARGGSRLTDEQLVSCFNAYAFPTFTMNAYAHILHLQSYRPHPTDPERMWYDFFDYRRLAPGEERPTPKIRNFVRPGEGPSPGKTIEEDISAVLEVQHGMRSPGFQELVLGQHEARLIHMHGLLDKYLARPA